ncbi:MAG: ABC transporter ATP-binding protein [Erysipelotrichaceae bacterium]|nr:ABC transporter ATP-binding protein [Erysipelotrichaceae bacterium]
MKDKKLFKRIFSYMRPFWLNYLIALVLTGIVVVCDILNPIVIGKSLAEIGEDNINFNKVILLFVIGIILAISQSIVQYFQTMLLQHTGQNVVFKMRKEVFTHIQSLSHNQFNNIPVGTLVTRVSSDINVLFQLYTNVLVNIIKCVATMIGVLIAMFLLDVKLALIILCVFPIILTLTIVFRYFLRKIHSNVRTEVSNMNAFLSENISGMKVTQIFNQENKKYNEFNTVNTRLKKASLKEIFTFGIFRPSVYLIYILTVIFILYTGSNDVINAGFGTITICITYDALYTFYQLISKFFNPIQTLADQYNTLQSSFAAAEKIFTVLDIEPEIKDSPVAIDVDIIGNIEFKNVWFSYVDDEWILKDVSFTINSKDVVAFVGATGAGKTTILSLITRNYDIKKGQILIDGIDIKKIKLSSLRSQIGQMLQDVFLFSGTIADNIRLNDETITDEEILKACEEVNAIHFINKQPDGIYAKVGERGNNLSLGERQLISFARVLVHKPKLMILDEATSNIDTETEMLIQDTLEKVIKSNTMIMVAHRLSTIQHANKIFVFDKGRIIESGSHQELLKQRGRYYQLYKLQYQKNPFLDE